MPDLPLHPPPDADARLNAVLARWPRHRPVALVHSGGAPGGWNRWTIVAAPRAWVRWPDPDAPGVTLEARLAALPRRGGPGVPGFAGGWLGVLDYELGAHLEPAVPRRTPQDERRPLLELARCDDGLVYDHAHGVWSTFGRPPVHPDELPEPLVTPGLEIGPWSSSPDGPGYRRAVERTLDYIRAGDVFQANIARRLTATFRGDPRVLAGHALSRSAAWYGAYLELPDGRTVVSMSPELFLAVDGATGAVVTRPIKGTRPAHDDPDVLHASEKDAAELHMIVDLMRNDLGRVARFGSVTVPAGRVIETHPTVHHGVGEVRAVLREDVSTADLLRATFPPGSITGAPKIRAMQIIHELEPESRGAYCGAIGWFGDDGSLGLNVAIRTIELHAYESRADGPGVTGTLAYGIGAGIVADSDPEAELRETEDKAAVLRLALAEARRLGAGERVESRE